MFRECLLYQADDGSRQNMLDTDWIFSKNRKVSLHTDRNRRHFRDHPRSVVWGGDRTKFKCSKTALVNFKEPPIHGSKRFEYLLFPTHLGAIILTEPVFPLVSPDRSVMVGSCAQLM